MLKEPVSGVRLKGLASVALTLFILSLLHLSFFALDGYGRFTNFAGIILSVMTALTAVWLLKRSRSALLIQLFLLYSAVVCLFALRLFDPGRAVAPEVLQVLLLSLNLGMIVCVFVNGPYLYSKPLRAAAIFGAAALAFGFYVIFVKGGRENNKTDVAFAALSVIQLPDSEVKTYYPSNPRHYFQADNLQRRMWWFRTSRDVNAELVFEGQNEEIARVNIRECKTKRPYDVQLNLPHLPVKANHNYRLEFLVKADKPRSFYAGIAQSHPPWDGLGYYQRIDIDQQWQTIRKTFKVQKDDDNARIHFDLGVSETSIEFSSVKIRAAGSDELIEPQLPVRYFISYRFNSAGCRGPEFYTTRFEGTSRVMILGGLSALGLGVREQDTLASNLQRELNESGEPHYEVINCGLSQSGIRNQRAIYARSISRYRPRIVLLVTSVDDAENDLDQMSKEILLLKEEARRNGARLALVSFRNNSDFQGKTETGRRWNDFESMLQQKLSSNDIPLLLIGSSLFSQHSEKELQVYPGLDAHPNEIANRIAAERTADFVESLAGS